MFSTSIWITGREFHAYKFATRDARVSTFEFEAECVTGKHPDDKCHLVGFADKSQSTRYYLMLQRALGHDEQDVQLGMDTYHAEWCDQRNSWYGGIKQFMLTPNQAVVVFDSEAADLINDMSRLLISFQVPPAEHAGLQQALSHIFRGVVG